MLDGFARYAIYLAPEPGSALARAGAAWLGYDVATGEPAAQPAVARLAEGALADIAARPARYGFHATLKAPFALRAGAAAAALDAGVAAYAAERAAVAIGRLQIVLHHGFLAIMPVSQPEALTAAAFEVVKAFEPFRAPLSAEDAARRGEAGLTPRQEALMAEFGYPYVAEEFALHFTLSRRLCATEAPALLVAARAHFAQALAEPAALDALALFGDPGRGARFRMLTRHRFGAPA